MINPLGRALFRVIDYWSGESIAGRLRELEVTQFWTPERLRELQLEKLRRLMRHAGVRVPYYRQAFAAAGLRPDRFEKFEQLEQLPALSKRDVTEAGPTILDPDPEQRYRWDVTSGSTGSPMRFRKSLSAFGWHRAHSLRCLGWYDVRGGERQARVWGVPIRAKDRRRERVRDLMLNRARYGSFELDEGAVAAKLRQMARQRPSYLFGYPSAIHVLARWLLEHGRTVLGSWRPKAIMTTAELLFEDQRRDIGEGFECPMANEYGASELTIMASSCPAGSMHLNDEAVLTEFQPTEIEIDGVRAYSMVFTDLNNLSMPLIRYRIGDLAVPVEGPCSCGRGLRRIRLLGGREVDVLRPPSGRTVHGSIFSYLGKSLLVAGGVRNFRAVQVERDLLEVEIEKGPDFDPTCLERMRVELARHAGADLRVEFLPVDRLMPESSGKLRYFINLVDGSGDPRIPAGI